MSDKIWSLPAMTDLFISRCNLWYLDILKSSAEKILNYLTGCQGFYVKLENANVQKDYSSPQYPIKDFLRYSNLSKSVLLTFSDIHVREKFSPNDESVLPSNDQMCNMQLQSCYACTLLFVHFHPVALETKAGANFDLF